MVLQPKSKRMTFLYYFNVNSRTIVNGEKTVEIRENGVLVKKTIENSNKPQHPRLNDM